jgi:hypothetical protein
MSLTARATDLRAIASIGASGEKWREAMSWSVVTSRSPEAARTAQSSPGPTAMGEGRSPERA